MTKIPKGSDLERHLLSPQNLIPRHFDNHIQPVLYDNIPASSYRSRDIPGHPAFQINSASPSGEPFGPANFVVLTRSIGSSLISAKERGGRIRYVLVPQSGTCRRLLIFQLPDRTHTMNDGTAWGGGGCSDRGPDICSFSWDIGIRG
jgi:hypothetical protein